MPHPPEHKLRWYQYKLSSLFILTILVCLASSWYATVMHNAAKRRKAIAEIEKLGGSVGYYGYFDPADPFSGAPDTAGEPPRWYSWLRKLHGDEHLGNAVIVDLNGRPVADAGMVNLKGLTKLEWLGLGGTQITVAGLVNLKGLTKLRTLNLVGPQVTDAGLVHLKGLTKLEWLFLSNTPITDEGVKKLQEALPNCKINHF